jgi:putative tricarboxylic transport membrane protein
MRFGSLLFAGTMLLVGVVYGRMALDMPRGSLSRPGPALFPLIVGAFLVATALGCVVQELLALRRAREAAAPVPAAPVPVVPAVPAPADAPADADRNVKPTFQLIALMIGYMLLLKPVGFPLAMFAFLAVAIRIFGYRRWAPTAAIAAIIAAASYVSFVLWLKVPLPLGLLEDVLG